MGGGGKRVDPLGFFIPCIEEVNGFIVSSTNEWATSLGSGDPPV